jgi:GNAT superfamily N-acetyltransferase
VARTPAPSAIAIRSATAADAARLAAQRCRLFEEIAHYESPAHKTAFEAAAETAFRESLSDGTCAAWLAESGGAPVGSVALLIYPRLPSPASPARREGYLLNVYTVPEWRGVGVATALVAVAVKKARELGLARIRLHATAKGHPVYAAQGFAARDDEMELKLT